MKKYFVGCHDIYTGKDEVIEEYENRVDAEWYITQDSKLDRESIYYIVVM